MLSRTTSLALGLAAFGLLLTGCPGFKNDTSEDLLPPPDLTRQSNDLAGDLIAPPDLLKPSGDLPPPGGDLTVPEGDLLVVGTDDMDTADLKPYLFHIEVIDQPTADYLITYCGDESMVETADCAPLTFRVVNGSGNPVPNIETTLTLPPGWASFNQSLTSDPGDGTGYFQLYAGPVPGTYQVTIGGGGVEPKAITVKSIAPVASKLVLAPINWTQFYDNSMMLPAAAIDRSMLSPFSIAPDSLGGYFVADPEQNRIFYVDAQGTMTLAAGAATSGGDAGDGGPAIDALLSGPWSVSIDEPNHKLYFLDQTTFVSGNASNQPISSTKIRVIDLNTGNISLFAGGTGATVTTLQAALAAQSMSAKNGVVAYTQLGALDEIKTITGTTVATVLTESGTCTTAGQLMGCDGIGCQLALTPDASKIFMTGAFCVGAGPATAGAFATVTLPGGAVATPVSGGPFDSGKVYSVAEHAGDFYIAHDDGSAPLIYKIPNGGDYEGYAGGGNMGFVDFVTAAEAELFGEISLAVRSDGRLLFTIDAGVRLIY